jgi:hypothetical protein
MIILKISKDITLIIQDLVEIANNPWDYALRSSCVHLTGKDDILTKVDSSLEFVVNWNNFLINIKVFESNPDSF